MALMSLLLRFATSLLRSGWCGELEPVLLDWSEEILGLRGSGSVLIPSEGECSCESGRPGALVTAAMLNRADVELDFATDLCGVAGLDSEVSERAWDQGLCEPRRPRWLMP